MKLFGNSKRRTTPKKQNNEQARPPVREENCSPKRAIILFCGALGVFVGVIIMCLVLIQRSGEQSFQPPETEVKELEYIVNGETAQSTEPTEPLPELTAPEGMNGSDVLNILFLVPDSATGRTDTLMLFKLDLNSKDLALLSLPRDTYISGNYELPKLHQVYYAAEGGDRGAQALKEKVKEMVGFWPDYYFVLDHQALSLMVELAGGSVEFELPNSPAYTELDPGKHGITGANALELLQYSDNFSQIETDSTKIQRDFFLKLLGQFLSETKDIMAVAEELSNVIDTDLTDLDLAYLVDFLKKANLNSTYSTCLPGKEIKTDGNIFFQVDIEKAVSLLNSYFNPTEEELSIYDVNFRQKTGDSGEGHYSDFGFPTTPSTTKPTEGSMPDPTEPPSSEGNGEPSELPDDTPDETTQAPSELPDNPPADSGDTP